MQLAAEAQFACLYSHRAFQRYAVAIAESMIQKWSWCSGISPAHHAAGWGRAICLFAFSSFFSRVCSGSRGINEKNWSGCSDIFQNRHAACWGSAIPLYVLSSCFSRVCNGLAEPMRNKKVSCGALTSSSVLQLAGEAQFACLYAHRASHGYAVPFAESSIKKLAVVP